MKRFTHKKGLWWSIINHNMKESDILVISVIIKLPTGVIFKLIFSLNMKVQSPVLWQRDNVEPKPFHSIHISLFYYLFWSFDLLSALHDSKEFDQNVWLLHTNPIEVSTKNRNGFEKSRNGWKNIYNFLLYIWLNMK